MKARQVVALGLTVPLSGCTWQLSGSRDRTDVTGGEHSAVDATAETLDVVVDRIVDGDSIEVIVDGAEIELRLEGYNAPELYAVNADGDDAQTCNGLAARGAVGEAIGEAESVELIAGGTDRFGRTLGDLIVDGESLVDRLIGDGHGLATGDDEARRALMVEAASSGLGVWGDGCGEPVHRRLGLGEIRVDAPGDDRDNLGGEYVQVVNVSSDVVELDGWVLRDDTAGHQFPLPGLLPAGERLSVFTGGDRFDSDVPGSRAYSLGESFPVWSNDWETVILVDPNGVFTDWRFVAEGEILLPEGAHGPI